MPNSNMILDEQPNQPAVGKRWFPRWRAWWRKKALRVPEFSHQWATVLISLAALVIIFAQALIYNEQRKTMNDTRDVMNRQTGIMERQTSIMEKTLLMNRAYVGVVSLTANTKDGKVTLLLENIGRLPADKVTLDVRETRRIEDASNGSISHFELGQPLVPGGKIPVIIDLAKFTSQETEKIAKKTERLFVSGKITYEDGFGNANTINFGFEYYPPPDEGWFPRSELVRNE